MQDASLWTFFLLVLATVAIVVSGVPIAYGLSVLCIAVTFLIVGEERLPLLGSVAYGEVAHFSLIAVPLFIATAELLSQARLSDGAFEVIARRLRRLPGSLAVASNVLSTIFAAIVGSSSGNTAIMGLVALRPMLERGYSERLATGVIVAGGALGVLIPPSTLFVLYAVVTELSVGQLLIAGLVPGLLMSALMTVYILVVAKLRPEMVGRQGQRPAMAQVGAVGARGGRISSTTSTSDDTGFLAMETLDAARTVPDADDEGKPEPVPDKVEPDPTKRSVVADMRVVLPIILLLTFMTWGIYSGLATASEIAGIGAAAAFLLVLSYRRMSARMLHHSLLGTVRVTAMILLIVVMAAYLGRLFSFMGVGDQLISGVTGLGWVPLGVVFGVCGLLLVLGCFLDSAAMVLVLGPLLHLLMLEQGLDPIWWAVIFVITLEIGLITPPFGINLFVMKSIAPDIPMASIIRGALPFIAVMIVTLVICILFPDLVLWLPRTMN